MESISVVLLRTIHSQFRYSARRQVPPAIVEAHSRPSHRAGSTVAVYAQLLHRAADEQLNIDSHIGYAMVVAICAWKEFGLSGDTCRSPVASLSQAANQVCEERGVDGEHCRLWE